MTSGVALTDEEIVAKKAAMVEWITESVKGNFTQACSFVGIARATGYQWKAADEAFSKAIDGARKLAAESGLDMLESAIFQAVNSGNIAAIIFSLKCLGRERGWIEKTDVGFDGNLKVTHDASREYIFSKLLPEVARSRTPETIEQPNGSGVLPPPV